LLEQELLRQVPIQQTNLAFQANSFLIPALIPDPERPLFVFSFVG
jgi:hypothetical protein